MKLVLLVLDNTGASELPVDLLIDNLVCEKEEPVRSIPISISNIGFIVVSLVESVLIVRLMACSLPAAVSHTWVYTPCDCLAEERSMEGRGVENVLLTRS